jgi:hypothetical protein
MQWSSFFWGVGCGAIFLLLIEAIVVVYIIYRDKSDVDPD